MDYSDEKEPTDAFTRVGSSFSLISKILIVIARSVRRSNLLNRLPHFISFRSQRLMIDQAKNTSQSSLISRCFGIKNKKF